MSCRVTFGSGCMTRVKERLRVGEREHDGGRCGELEMDRKDVDDEVRRPF